MVVESGALRGRARSFSRLAPARDVITPIFFFSFAFFSSPPTASRIVKKAAAAECSTNSSSSSSPDAKKKSHSRSAREREEVNLPLPLFLPPSCEQQKGEICTYVSLLLSNRCSAGAPLFVVDPPRKFLFASCEHSRFITGSPSVIFSGKVYNGNGY